MSINTYGPRVCYRVVQIRVVKQSEFEKLFVMILIGCFDSDKFVLPKNSTKSVVFDCYSENHVLLPDTNL